MNPLLAAVLTGLVLGASAPVLPPAINVDATQVLVAVIAAVAAIAAAGIATRQTIVNRRENRHERLEARLARSERDNRLLWLWCRELVDHIYRGEQPPPPPSPAGLFEDTLPRSEVRNGQ